MVLFSRAPRSICTPRSPNCLICPWMEGCEGRRRGIAETLPRKAAKVADRYAPAFAVVMAVIALSYPAGIVLGAVAPEKPGPFK